jgi:hypothetical protein
MSFFNQYDPEGCFLNLAGIIVSGFAKGTFIEIERTEAVFTLKTGSQDDATRTINRNSSGKVKFTLMQQAPCNDRLMELLQKDMDTLLGYGALSFTEFLSTTVADTAWAWIEKIPKVERGEESMVVQWEVDCHKLKIKVGGAVINV